MEERIRQMKMAIIEAAHLSGEGHIPSGISILDILIVLYDKILQINPKKPNDPNRDRFILSKGHGSLGLYVVLSDKGFFSKKHLKEFSKYEGILGGHPDSNKVPGVEVSTGTLGHGFPTAVGMALGLKIDNNPAKVFVIVGDGEANEGTVWESALLGSHHKLDNLTCIIDHNHSGDRALMVDDLRKKFESFGWMAITVNGHDHKELFDAMTSKHQGQPLAVIAETIKGYGIKSMEGNHAWHHKSPTKEEMENLFKEIK